MNENGYTRYVNKPGGKFSYSNAGFLAAIDGKVIKSGMEMSFTKPSFCHLNECLT